MSKFIILPIVMTHTMCGYSAIGIEVTDFNLDEIIRLKNRFLTIRAFDENISEIVFHNPTIEFHCFNNNFEHDDELKVLEISDDDFMLYTNTPDDDNSQLEDPILSITDSLFCVKFNSESDISELYAHVLFEALDLK